MGTNAVALSNVDFTPGKVGKAFSFQSSDSAAKVPATPSLDVGAGEGFTVETWIRPTDISVPNQWVVGWKSSTGIYGVHLKISQIGPVGSLVANIKDKFNRNHLVFTGSVLVSNEFQHVAFTYDKSAGVTRIFHNGIVVAEQVIGSYEPETSFQVVLGERASEHPLEAPFKGELDELSVYDEALDTNDIAGIYAAGVAGKCAPSSGACAPVTDMVAWWRAEGDPLDAIGNSHAVLNDDGSGFAAGRVGTAFSFDGTNGGAVAASGSLNLGTNSGFTIEAWVLPTAVENPNQWILGWKSPVGTYGVMLKVSQNGNVGSLLGNVKDQFDNNILFSSSPVLTNGEFQHVALSYDRINGIGRLYWNGAIVAEAGLGSYLPETSFPFVIGERASAHPAESGFQGMIDEVSVYRRALSESEIRTIHAAGSAGKCWTNVPPPTCATVAGLVSWWRGDGNGLDSAGGNNGVVLEDLSFGLGRVGQGFLALTSGASLRIPASSTVDVGAGEGLTIEAWINPANPALRSPIAEWNDGSGSWGVHFWVAPDAPGQLYANIVTSRGAWRQISTAAGLIESNVFQHVALTYDKASGRAALYKNGQIVAESILGSFTPLTSYDLYLGWRASGPPGDTGTFLGVLDEVSLYNRALGTNEIAAIYNAGSFGKCDVNQAPVAAADSFTTAPNTAAAFAAAKLILNDNDPDSDALTVVSVTANSSQGGSITFVNGHITYTPAAGFTGADSFTYTISDGNGGIAVGTVLVSVFNNGPVGLNIVFGPIALGGNFVVRFAGIPGQSYTIEAAPSIVGPWTKVTSQTAPTSDTGFGVGVFQFLEPVGTNATRFYRTIHPAY